MAKSTGQWIGTIFGAVVGFFIPGSYVMLGAAIGGAIGGAIDPPKGPNIVGPRVDDLKVQTSTYGAIKPRLYGTKMISGNIFWLEGDQIREVTTTEEQGGKGGGGQEVTTYSYYATFAVGLCKGPVTGIRRMWIGDELVYSSVNQTDSGATSDELAESAIAVMFQGLSSEQKNNEGTTSQSLSWTLYTGTDDQLPDPRMQADKGIANVSGYPGECYLVVKDLNLEKWSNTLLRAQVKVEIVAAGEIESVNTVIDDISVADSGNSRFALLGLKFDSIGANYLIQSWYAPNGNPEQLFWGRMEFPYSDTVSSYDINVVPGGWGYTYRFPSITQSDEQLAISFQTSSSFTYEKLWRFFEPTGLASSWFDYIAGYDTFSTRACIDRGQIFVCSHNTVGKVIEVFRDGGYGPETAGSSYDIICLGASENFVWGLLNTTATTTQTVYKFNRADLTLADTYSQTTGGGSPIWMDVIDDTTIYVSSTNASGARVTRWDDGVIVNTFLQLQHPTSTTLGLNGFKVFGEDPFSAYGLYPGSSSVPYDISVASPTLDDTPAKLRDIITAESGLVGVTPSDLALTTLTNHDVRGFTISAVAAVRSGFDPLQAAFPFDAYQAGYKVKFVSRGGASLGTIPEIDLGTSADGKEQNLLPVAREMDSQLPCRVSVVFPNAAREYDTDEQYAERLNVHSVSERRVELAIVLTPTEAARVADILLAKDWLERTTLGPFTLPPTWLHLEPSDIVTITHRGATYEARITRIEYRADHSLECSAVPSSAATYTSTAIGAEPLVTPPVLIALAGLTNLYLLDIPRINSFQDASGMAFAMFGGASGWPGAALLRSDDAGNSYQAVGAMKTLARVFQAGSALSSHDGYSIDYASVLTVTPINNNASLYSITEDQFYAETNLAAYGIDGRWEIVAFSAVTDNTGTYTLSNFMRGLYGSVWASGLHQAGDLFIMLDTTTVGFFGLPINALGSPRLYRAVTQGATLDSTPDITDTYESNNLKPPAPVDLIGNVDLSSHDWTISVSRRTRWPVELFSGQDVPHSESPLAFDFDIYSSGAYTSIKRTISSDAESATYTSAQQIADFGAEQTTLYVDSFQKSAVVGRGHVYRASIYRDVNTDPFAAQIVLYMMMENTSLSDGKGNAVTLNGNVARSATSPAIGSYSAIFDGSGDYIAVTCGSSLNLGTGNFTIEGYANVTNYSTVRNILSKYVSWATNVDFVVEVQTTGKLRFVAGDTAPINIQSNSAVPTGTNFHWAVCRNSGTTRLFINGTLQIANHVGTVTIPNDRTTLRIGANSEATPGEYYLGTQDAIRITTAARYTASFTPPTSMPEP